MNTTTAVTHTVQISGIGLTSPESGLSDGSVESSLHVVDNRLLGASWY